MSNEKANASGAPAAGNPKHTPGPGRANGSAPYAHLVGCLFRDLEVEEQAFVRKLCRDGKLILASERSASGAPRSRVALAPGLP